MNTSDDGFDDDPRVSGTRSTEHQMAQINALRTSSGGMSTPSAPLGARQDEDGGDRDFHEFDVPSALLGDLWSHSEFSDEDRTFGLTQITTEQSIRAGRFVGAKLDLGTAQQEQILMCLYTIGEKVVRRNRAQKVAWLEAIGPKGRQVVDFCWNKINTSSDAELDEVFSSGRRRRG